MLERRTDSVINRSRSSRTALTHPSPGVPTGRIRAKRERNSMSSRPLSAHGDRDARPARALAARRPVPTRKIAVARVCSAIGARSRENVVHVRVVSNAVHRIQSLGHGSFLIDPILVAVQLVEIRRDQQPLGVVPRPLSDPVTGVDRRLSFPRRCAQVCPPRVIARTFRLRQRLAVCVRSGKTSQVAALPEVLCS